VRAVCSRQSGLNIFAAAMTSSVVYAGELETGFGFCCSLVLSVTDGAEGGVEDGVEGGFEGGVEVGDWPPKMYPPSQLDEFPWVLVPIAKMIPERNTIIATIIRYRPI